LASRYIDAKSGSLFFSDSQACLQTVLEQGGSFAGINRKVQIKPLKWSQPEEGSKEEPRVTEALLILKHGGVLTHAGRQQVRASADAYLPVDSGLLLLNAPVTIPERLHPFFSACF